MLKQTIVFKEGNKIKTMGLPENIEFLQVINIADLPDTAYQECWKFDSKGKLNIDLSAEKNKSETELEIIRGKKLSTTQDEFNLAMAKDEKETAKKLAHDIDALKNLPDKIKKEIVKIKDFQQLKDYMPKCLIDK